MMSKRLDCDVDAVTEFVSSNAPLSFLRSRVGHELVYTLEVENIEAFSDMFEDLEENKDKLNIDSYDVTATTMKDVFIR